MIPITGGKRRNPPANAVFRIVSRVTSYFRKGFYNRLLDSVVNTADSRRPVNPWIVTAAVMLATFMEILDTTVVKVSVPHLAGNMGATVEEGTWVLTS